VTRRLRPGYSRFWLGGKSRENTGCSRPGAQILDAPLRAGMTVVIQPNVVTPDGKAGIQTGELVLITATGIESLRGRLRYCGGWRR
jgi:hypothetical protein